jgi:uncharacterized protein (DUF2147 family)
MSAPDFQAKADGRWVQNYLLGFVTMLITFALISSNTIAGASPLSPEGYWRTQDGQAVSRITPCGTRLCGTIVASSIEASGFDRQNREQKLRSRAICGLQIMSGFTLQAGSIWTEGTIYDPETGVTLTNVSLTLVNGQLELRVGSGPFAGHETWTRVRMPSKLCQTL